MTYRDIPRQLASKGKGVVPGNCMLQLVPVLCQLSGGVRGEAATHRSGGDSRCDCRSNRQPPDIIYIVKRRLFKNFDRSVDFETLLSFFFSEIICLWDLSSLKSDFDF